MYKILPFLVLAFMQLSCAAGPAVSAPQADGEVGVPPPSDPVLYSMKDYKVYFLASDDAKAPTIHIELAGEVVKTAKCHIQDETESQAARIVCNERGRGLRAYFGLIEAVDPGEND